MREQIKRIIDRELYNTEKADIVASDEYWDGHNLERQGRNTHLYRTKKGAFFLGISTQWVGELDRIEPLTLEAAKVQYEQLPKHKMSYKEAFGEELGRA